MSPTLARLLESLGPAEQLSFARLATAIYEAKFTGPTVIHWFNGEPKQIDLGSPIRLTICEGDEPPPPRRA